jgi:hypothetical protein
MTRVGVRAPPDAGPLAVCLFTCPGKSEDAGAPRCPGREPVGVLRPIWFTG